MTSAQFIAHERESPPAAVTHFMCGLWLVIIVILTPLGCAVGPKLENPSTLRSPYAAEEVWAVAPFVNESGTTAVDGYRAADLFAQELEQVDGLHAVPVNRVIRAMRELELERITSPAEAQQVARVLDVDALVTGSVTAYDPYPPPTLGLAAALFRTPHDSILPLADTRALTRSPKGEAPPDVGEATGPVAEAAGLFDASNHRTLRQLNDYTRGRSVPESAYGQDIYLVSSELYMRFVSYRLLHDLLARERQRQAAADESTPAPPR